jgi:RNA recognition motif-containing protein
MGRLTTIISSNYKIMPRRSHSSSSSSSSDSSRYQSSSSSSRSPSPVSRLLKVSNLTGNVNRNHLFEIFENYGVIKSVKLAEKQVHEGKLKRGYAYIKMVHREDASMARRCMDGGWIDGNIIGVSMVETKKHKRRYRPRSRSDRRSKRSDSCSSCSYRRS